MKALRQRGVRLLSAVFFTAMLLVPLLESGHNHVDRDLAKPCATCVATHHSPALQAPVVSLEAPLALAAVAISTTFASPIRGHHSPQSGRAPPHFSHIVSV